MLIKRTKTFHASTALRDWLFFNFSINLNFMSWMCNFTESRSTIDDDKVGGDKNCKLMSLTISAIWKFHEHDNNQQAFYEQVMWIRFTAFDYHNNGVASVCYWSASVCSRTLFFLYELFIVVVCHMRCKSS